MDASMSSTDLVTDRPNIAALQIENKGQRNRMIVSGAIAIGALVGCIILGSYAMDDYLRVGDLSDQLKGWNLEKSMNWWHDYAPGDGPIIQSQIDHLTSVGYQNLGGSIALLVTALGGACACIYYYTKKKESDGRLKPNTKTGPQVEMTPEQKGIQHKKRALMGFGVTAICGIACIILVSLALSSHFKIAGLWDKWHKWHDLKVTGNNIDPTLGPHLTDQIKHLTTTGWQELGFSLAFLGIGLGALGYGVHQWGKRKEQGAKEVAPPPENL
jgi:hypothetical protein